MTMSSLLFLLSSGWKLRYPFLNFDNDEDGFVPLVIIIAVLHLIVTLITFSDMDASNKIHDFAGVSGWVLVINKILIFAVFIW